MDPLLSPFMAAVLSTGPIEPTRSSKETRHIEMQEEGFMHSKQKGHEVPFQRPTEAGTLFEMFHYADITGSFRLATIYQDYKTAATESGTAAGLNMGFETATYHGVALKAMMYSSQKIGFLSPDSIEEVHPEYFDGEKKSYAYLALASVEYRGDGWDLEAGRIAVDVPFADPDDIRMSPNTFEGVSGSYRVDDLTLHGLWLHRMAGFDSEDSQNEFDLLYDNSNGLFSLGMTYGLNRTDEALFWLYHVDKMTDMAYGEYAGHIVFSDAFHIEYGVQAATMQERDGSGTGGDIAGGMIILDGGVLFSGLAFNIAHVDEGSTVTDGFGGGPYYTSLDEMTVAAVSELAPGHDVSAVRFGVGMNLETIGLEGMVVEAVYGYLEAASSPVKGCETDLIVTYAWDDHLNAELVWMDIRDDQLAGGERYERFQVRADYRF